MAHAWLVSIRRKAAEKKSRARVGRTDCSGGVSVAGGGLHGLPSPWIVL